MRFRFQMRKFTFPFNIFQTYLTLITHLLHRNTYKLNIKTNLLEEDVNFDYNTKKQNNFFKICITLIVTIMFLTLFFRLFKYGKK